MNKNLEDIKSEVHLMLQDLTNNELKDYFSNLIYCYDKLQQRIDKAIEYIENHSLYEEEYDYDYEENSYLSGIDDEVAKKDLLEILKGSDSNGQ